MTNGTGLSVCDVFGERTPPGLGEHDVGVAVVGRVDEDPAELVDDRDELRHALVDHLHRLDGRGQVAGVADHVAVG